MQPWIEAFFCAPQLTSPPIFPDLAWMEGTLGPHKLSACSRAWTGMELPSSEFEAASDAWGSASDDHCCLIQALPGTESTSVSCAQVFSWGLWQLQDQCCQPCGMDCVGLECFVWLGLGCIPSGHRKPLCLSCGQTSTCVLLMSRVEASHWPFVSASGPPGSQQSLSLCVGP